MDELSAYLEQHYGGNYITGKEDCNLLLWGTEDASNRPVPKLCTLMVGMEYAPYFLQREDITGRLNDMYRQRGAFRRLMDYGKYFAGTGKIGFAVIVYPSLREEYNGSWESSRAVYDEEKVQFYYSFFSKKQGDAAANVVDGRSLRDFLYDKLHCSYTDRGTTKEKNRKLADYFHMWSRDCLSKNIIKFDLDGFFLSNDGKRGILIEIKRSSIPPIPFWRPNYDKPDYMLQLEFSRMINADFWLLHHESSGCDNRTIISFFHITGIDEGRERDFIQCGKCSLQMPLTGPDSLDRLIADFLDNT